MLRFQNCKNYVIFKLEDQSASFPKLLTHHLYLESPCYFNSNIYYESKVVGYQLRMNCLKLNFKDQNELLKNTQ